MIAGNLCVLHVFRELLGMIVIAWSLCTDADAIQSTDGLKK